MKLNLKNPEVVDHLLGAVGSWIQDFGIDGLRLDAADCVDPDFFRAAQKLLQGEEAGFLADGRDYSR